jgi:hypothetical protein
VYPLPPVFLTSFASFALCRIGENFNIATPE